ncbi:MAG: hypothetical protein QM755_14350 [Luteolibacter sp.]
MRFKKTWALLGLLVSTTSGAFASKAAFSEDGKTLWVLSYDGKSLLAFDGKAPAPNSFPLPAPLGGKLTPMHLLADHDGLLLAGESGLWKWNPLAAGVAPESIAPLPTEISIEGLARVPEGPLAGAILINGRHRSGDGPQAEGFRGTLYALLPGEKQFRGVFTRHLHEVTASPAFAPGRMVLGGDYDLWEGSFALADTSNSLCGYLMGYRSAPLAQMETEEGNSQGQGVRSLVIVGNTIWALLEGHHASCSLVTLPLGKKFKGSDPESAPDVSQSWSIARQKLAEVKPVSVRDDEGGTAYDGLESIDCLCAWNGPQGDWKIVYRTHHEVLWEITSGQKQPRKIGIDPTWRNKGW